MTDKPVLVDQIKLRKIIAGLDLQGTKTKECIEARWLNYVLWWDSRARQAKWRHFTLRRAVVIGSALVATLAGAVDTKDADARVQAFLAPIRAALG